LGDHYEEGFYYFGAFGGYCHYCHPCQHCSSPIPKLHRKGKACVLCTSDGKGLYGGCGFLLFYGSSTSSSTDPPPATVTYSIIIGNSTFSNCVANHTTPGGTVYLTEVEAFQCSNTGQLDAGKLHAYFSATGQRVVCQVDVRPFRCFVE